MGALSLPSDRFARSGNPAWPGVRTANFAAFGSWSGVLPKNAESLRDSDVLMRVAVPRRRGPAGLRDLFRFCRNLWLYAPHSGLSMRARWGWYHYPRRALCTAEVLGARLSKQLICRFLRLLSSILCAVPFSANMQISLSAISVANAPVGNFSCKRFPSPNHSGALCFQQNCVQQNNYGLVGMHGFIKFRLSNCIRFVINLYHKIVISIAP